jgi:hypothetical protein
MLKIAINAPNGVIIWQSPVLDPSKDGHSVATPPIVCKDYVVGSGGDLPLEKEMGISPQLTVRTVK